jgi:predicted acetyltransferase
MVPVLRKLRPNDEEAFLRAFALTSTSDPNFAHYYRPGLPLEEYLGILYEAEQGRGLPDGHVPSTLLFGFVDEAIVGRLMLRHSLNDFLRRVGADWVRGRARASWRGYATEMLRRGLDLARSIGLEKVLVTCDEDNVASRRTIEKCGGEYEDSYSGPEARAGKRRYWIALSKPERVGRQAAFYNYLGDYDADHASNPTWNIFGSEVADSFGAAISRTRVASEFRRPRIPSLFRFRGRASSSASTTETRLTTRRTRARAATHSAAKC